ncbi:hypothetical protein Hanom_Chr13g01184381 [Helianthus anomalus]
MRINHRNVLGSLKNVMSLLHKTPLNNVLGSLKNMSCHCYTKPLSNLPLSRHTHFPENNQKLSLAYLLRSPLFTQIHHFWASCARTPSPSFSYVNTPKLVLETV